SARKRQSSRCSETHLGVAAAVAAKVIRPCRHGQECGSLFRLLRVCLRYLAQEQPHPARSGPLGPLNELAEYNRQVLREILEKVSADDPQRSPVLEKIGDFYQSCMDEPAVNARGIAGLKPGLDRIAAVKSKPDLVDTIAYLQSLGVNVLFGFRSQPDLHNASMEIAGVSQGGLGLPDRDYYLAQDEKSKETREKYLAHVTKMFTLAGD